METQARSQDASMQQLFQLFRLNELIISFERIINSLNELIIRLNELIIRLNELMIRLNELLFFVRMSP